MNDVAIIGGSAAGFFTARLLARKGIPVRVFESSERIDPDPRTLIVTDHLLQLLGPSCEKAVVNRIKSFELFADGKVATVPLQRPDLIIERAALIKSLADQAEKSGAKILTGRRFQGIEPDGDRLSFTMGRNGHATRESARVLIGADGTFSSVAESMGWPRNLTAPLVQAVVDLPGDMPPDTTRVWFIPEDTPFFYWLIPHSETQGVLGLIGREENHTVESLERFAAKKDLHPCDVQKAEIPLYTRWQSNRKRLGENDVYLVGDAAAHVKVSTVGGIVTGLRGALAVAEAVLNGGTSPKIRALRRELDRHRVVRRVLHHYRQKDYIRLLELLTPSTKAALSSITRDDTLKLLLSLSVRQPRLLLTALRGLLLTR